MTVDAVILAAGQGTRMRPFSNLITKCMLPLANKPVLHILVERLIDAGVKKIVIVVSPSNQDEIKSLFQNIDTSIAVEFAIQNYQKGTAHAITIGGAFTEADHILSVAGDSLFPSEFYKQIIYVRSKFYFCYKNK